MSAHCTHLKADRGLGEQWERNFCRLAGRYGLSFTPMQIGRAQSAQAFSRNGNSEYNSYTLPDITIWTAPGQHHEIKHKDPTSWDTYGLEVYRFQALLWFARETEQDVLYTIHNHALSGGRDSPVNDIAHWFTIDILTLDGSWSSETTANSWVNGIKREVPIYYWPTFLWRPLAEYWRLTHARNQQRRI